MAHLPPPAPLVKGISAQSKSASYACRALYKKVKGTASPAPAAPASLTKPIGGPKNGKTRTIPAPASGLAAYDPDVKTPKVTRKSASVRAPKTRASITPGTVLVLLGGRFRGKRVVYLKTLASGLLLVSGPHKINGVPLKRVNQAFVIATSTKVANVSTALPAAALAKFDDAYFARTKTGKAKATAQELFDAAQLPKGPEASRVADQKAVDGALLPLVKKTPLLVKYLNASFALTKGQYPHALLF